MTTVLKQILAVLICTVFLGGLYTPSYAADCDVDEPPVEQVDFLRASMSGSGSISSGNMSIYYPPGYPGYIQVLSGGANVITPIYTDGSGYYTGPCGGLSAKTYDLSYVYMSGTVPYTLATGKLVIIA